ncbi:hypothetical protein BCR42DRAFT_358885 [Absidia repens]|uniref:SH3 domain-containing protein n=1 Tax=Absidia repens TaxID=90262 RepID=A0A1X2I598_9FUNG|nr:hypothetical protein BCR42DRAFT_358885 [Absidia repens]
MATTVLRFSDSFWDEEDRGIDILTEKLTNSEQTCQDLKKIYEIRAQIEKDYGERLLELSHYTLGEIELGTLAMSMQRIPFAFETTARAHIDMAEQLNTTLEAPLTSFLKEQCELINARSHQMENSKHLKDMHQTHVEKAKQAHDEIQELLKQKQENGEDVETVKNSLALADRDWQHSVEILQEVTDKFSLDWKITCDLYQDLEERRINFIRSNVWAFANMMSSVYIVDDRGCEGIRTGLEATDVRKDINDFILKYGTSVKMSPTTINGNQSDPYPSPKSTQNESSPPGAAIDDSMTFAYQEVENMLSDSGIMKRSSLDQQSHHSNQSPKKSSFQSNATTPRGSLDKNQHEDQHQRQLSVTSLDPPSSAVNSANNYSSPPSSSSSNMSPQMITPVANATKEISPASHSPQQNSSSSPTLTNGYTSGMNMPSIASSSSNQRLSNTSNSSSSSAAAMERTQRQSGATQHSLDDSDDNDEPKRPVRVPKPREEKWTISARRTGPSATARTANNTTTNTSSNINTGASITSNQTSGTQPLSSTNQKIKNGYLDPTVHPPPLQQQQYYGVTQPQTSSSLYPPEQYASSHPASSKRNSGSSLYHLTPSAASSTSSLTIDVAGTQKPLSTSTGSQKPTTYPPMMYQSTTTLPASAYVPPTATSSAYRPPPISTSAAYHPSSVAPATYQQPTAGAPPTTSTYQPPTTATTPYRPIVATTTPYQPTSTTAPTYHPTKNTSYQSSVKPVAQKPMLNQTQSLASIETMAQDSSARIGIRPPEWQDQRQGELEGSAATDYMKGEGAPTSPARSGLQRYNSVNGPREPPAKDNYIASSDLKNTRGFGEETVTILEEDSASINDMNKKKEPVAETDPTTMSDTKNNDSTDADGSTPATTATDTDTTGEQVQETPKSGFSFNNIFFRKDKNTTADDGLRLPDGTVYKHKVRAMWSYEAKIDSELSFQANDSLAVIRKQPDGWWEAEIIDDKRRQRGLVPGNYMSLN